MADISPVPTSCAHPTVGARAISTYTVMGFVGYGAANIAAAALMVAWRMALGERLICAFAPPLAFLAVVAAMRRIVGHERIVFYETAAAGMLAVVAFGLATGGDVPRMLDVTVTGIGIFLAFGRIGCFAVACCHGRPARFGVVYGDAHVKVGLWWRWAHRRLWPTQLVESAATAALVAAGLVVGWDAPGMPAYVYLLGYAPVRFALELVRGDSARPHARGVSEAQWTALATAAACLAWRPTLAALAVTLALAAAVAAIAATHRRRAWFAPPHLHELGKLADAAARDPSAPRVTSSLGISVSCHPLPDGRVDWIASTDDPRWTVDAARRLAAGVWRDFELVPGRLPSVMHVIAAPPPPRAR